jgi:uncharacterized membrane protein
MLEIRTVPAGRGAAWLLEGWKYFESNAGAWIGIGLIMIAISFVSMIVVFAGVILQFLAPVFIGGLVLGCREISAGRKLTINHLFAGFSQHTGNLMLLSVLYFLGTLVIMVLMVAMLFMLLGVDFITAAMREGDIQTVLNGDMEFLADSMRSVLLVVLTGLLFFLPLVMAFWFAPVLIVLDGYSAVEAMKHSFTGCLKNILPFLVYGVVGLVLSFLAAIPLMLGWFILMPMVVASLYIAYRDIYTAAVKAV